MKRLRHLLLVFVPLACSTLACNSSKYTTENLPEPQLIFGNGGGITGATNSYILLENGQLFQKNSLTDSTKEVTPISKKQAKLLYQQVQELKIDSLEFNHPGNRYFFIQHLQEGTRHELTWGDMNHKIPKEIETFYKSLFEIVNSQNDKR